MKNEYIAPEFEVCKVTLIKDSLAPSVPVTEDPVATQSTDVTEWDPFFD